MKNKYIDKYKIKNYFKIAYIVKGLVTSKSRNRIRNKNRSEDMRRGKK